jgi:hypothetical protein
MVNATNSIAELGGVIAEKKEIKGKLKLPKRSESVVKIPIKQGAPKLGIVRKQEKRGVFLVEAVTRLTDGYVMTSILNTNESEIEIEEPVTELEEVDLDREMVQSCVNYENREKVILDQLRLDHLNSEERKLLVETCLTYTDIFYLPGDRLSSTNTTRHSIRLEAGVEPYARDHTGYPRRKS